VPPWFPGAAQADIVRAAQKDKLCMGVLESCLYDAVQSVMGPAFFMKHRHGLRALACALYHGTTTGMMVFHPVHCVVVVHVFDAMGRATRRTTNTVCALAMFGCARASIFQSFPQQHFSPVIYFNHWCRSWTTDPRRRVLRYSPGVQFKTSPIDCPTGVSGAPALNTTPSSSQDCKHGSRRGCAHRPGGASCGRTRDQSRGTARRRSR
jgi:hypothetical protein